MKILRLVISLFVILTLLGGCAGNPPAHISQLEEKVAALTAENDALRRQVQELAAAAEEPPSQLEEADPAKAEKLESLLARTDLIPVEAALGGTMRYFPGEAKLLGTDLAYAYAEDGHNAVEMLLRCTGGPAYDWTLIAYDAGGGWQLQS
ncbi:hypothetical protein [Anaerotruncus rubiinfantis]|jgi:outer membrane murein-binding lipoprotein Lpp|uniref:hypothetical protein n=1 Tax=Anaerotruncus rubiinfantis TaxID=1720200 RepID=UPI000ABFDDF5|nr:hypothetical protein [Anaerotruncus rubiinfantis]